MYNFIKLGDLIIPKSQVKYIKMDKDVSHTKTIDKDIYEYHGFVFTITYQINSDEIKTFKIYIKNPRGNVLRQIMERGTIKTKYEYNGCESKNLDDKWFKEYIKYLESLAVSEFRNQVFIEL